MAEPDTLLLSECKNCGDETLPGDQFCTESCREAFDYDWDEDDLCPRCGWPHHGPYIPSHGPTEPCKSGEAA